MKATRLMNTLSPDQIRQREIARITLTLAGAHVPVKHVEAMNDRHWGVIAAISEVGCMPTPESRAIVIENLRELERDATMKAGAC